MSVYRVGQRVRYVGTLIPRLAGAEGTVATVPYPSYVRPGEFCYVCVFPGSGANFSGPDTAECYGSSLAPLSDPKADEFIERIKNMKPYQEPVVTKERVA